MRLSIAALACSLAFVGCGPEAAPDDAGDVDAPTSDATSGADANGDGGGERDATALDAMTPDDAGDGDAGCPSPRLMCASGCIDPDTDVLDCGRCDHPCPTTPHSVPLCFAGACSRTCDTGYGDCDDDPTNGCERPTDADPTSCGTCGHVCPAAANATPTCGGSACGIACVTGFADCDGDASNGCETDTRIDATSCNACGNVCPDVVNATPTCGASTCGFSCASGFADCDGDASNGCETDTRVDAMSCSACGVACSYGPESMPVCASSTCAIACAPGFGDCDGDASTGCEIDTTSAPASCGGCGTACPVPANATATCASSTCGFACAAGFADCGAGAADGCETDTRITPTSCGSCGNVCPTPANAIPTCASSSCAFACTTDYVDLNASATDGCECHRLSATDDPDSSYVDSNCDGIDGDASHAVFVSPLGTTTGDGSRTSPLREINPAVTRARAIGATQILVAVGTYGAFVASAGFGIHGGYDATTWTRSAARSTAASITFSSTNAPAKLVSQFIATGGVSVPNSSINNTLSDSTVRAPAGSAGTAGVDGGGSYGGSGGYGSSGGDPGTCHVVSLTCYCSSGYAPSSGGSTGYPGGYGTGTDGAATFGTFASGYAASGSAGGGGSGGTGGSGGYGGYGTSCSCTAGGGGTGGTGGYGGNGGSQGYGGGHSVAMRVDLGGTISVRNVTFEPAVAGTGGAGGNGTAGAAGSAGYPGTAGTCGIPGPPGNAGSPGYGGGPGGAGAGGWSVCVLATSATAVTFLGGNTCTLGSAGMGGLLGGFSGGPRPGTRAPSGRAVACYAASTTSLSGSDCPFGP